MPCKVIVKEDFKKLEETHPNLCDDVARQFLKEKGYKGYICTYNSLTAYYDLIWVYPEMFEEVFNEPKYFISLENPLSAIINTEVSEDIWEAFQEACKEQYNNGLGYVCFFVEIKDFSQYFRLPKEDIFVE